MTLHRHVHDVFIYATARAHFSIFFAIICPWYASSQQPCTRNLLVRAQVQRLM
jgi:hypothetical protein